MVVSMDSQYGHSLYSYHAKYCKHPTWHIAALSLPIGSILDSNAQNDDEWEGPPKWCIAGAGDIYYATLFQLHY